MAFLKPSGITGLNTSHPLYSKINGFWEIGQLDKELLADTSITYAATPTYTSDGELGDCRLFQAGANSFSTDFVPGNSGSLLVVWKINNDLSTSETPRLVERASSGHIFYLGANTFGTVNSFQLIYRGQFGTQITETYDPGFTDNAVFQAAHALGGRWNNANGTGLTYDGNAVESNTTATNSYNQTTQLTMADDTQLDAYISAVVWFDELSDSELIDITTDGNFWALVDTGGTGVNAPVTGVTATGQLGEETVTTAANVAVTGVSATGQLGNVTVSTATSETVVVTGVTATGQLGEETATGAASTSVTGVAATGQLGEETVTTAANVTATGVSATGQLGEETATGAAAAPVTGVSATGQVGTATAEASETANVTGFAALAELGDITIIASANVAVTGLQADAGLGTVSAGQVTEVSTTGVSASTLLGSASVLVRILAPVNGLQAISRVNSVNVWGIVDESQSPGWSATGGGNTTWTDVTPSGGRGWTPLGS